MKKVLVIVVLAVVAVLAQRAVVAADDWCGQKYDEKKGSNFGSCS